MTTICRRLPLLVALLLPALARAADAPPRPAVQRDKDALIVTLPGDVQLTFLTHGKLLLGLQQAHVAGVALTSADTVLRPVLAQEFGPQRTIWPFMELVSARVDNDTVVLEADLLATRDDAAFRAFFTFAADAEKALSQDLPPAVAALRTRRDAAAAALEAHFAQDAQYAKLAADLAAARTAMEATGEDTPDRALAEQALQRASNQLSRRRKTLAPAAPADLVRAHQEAQAAFDAALAPLAVAAGDIHRDSYRFALPQQPEAICNVAALQKQADALAPSLVRQGRITWVIAPETRNIAGWQWVGWKQHYRVTLPAEQKINVLRQLGTWEIDGHAGGLTAVALRYRGLGRIEQRFTPDQNAPVAEAFNTADIIPGSAGEGMAVSPVIPPSKAINDRGYALRHRAGAWIAIPPRGAAAPFVDFQFRPHAAFAAFHDRQGNLRALTEAYPGDRCLSQTDEQWFPLSSDARTQPQVYLALVTRDKPLTVDESRTRWKELDQHVRDAVSDELRFVQHDPLPGFGVLIDFNTAHAKGWADTYTGMTRNLDKWHNEGVQVIVSHNPGWITGRHTGPGGPPRTYGGACDIYDWSPTSDVRGPWKTFTAAASEKGIGYYVWIGQTQTRHAPFVQRVGLAKENWSLNVPTDPAGPGYGRFTMKGNILNDRFRQEFVNTLNASRRDVGFDGFWIDSFHNLFMSQLDMAATGNSMQRAWWEQLAAFSRDGVAIMAESHAFPGLSCSIEVADWQKDPWYFQYVWKWHRGTSQKNLTPEAHDRIAFTLMANKGWAAPDLTQSDWYRDAHEPIDEFRPSAIVPSFTRFAREYTAALPRMKRPYILPEGKGVLWLSNESDSRGVLFPFVAIDAPAGLRASPILPAGTQATTTKPAGDALLAQHTYTVEGADLRALLGVRTPPLADPRVKADAR